MTDPGSISPLSCRSYAYISWPIVSLIVSSLIPNKCASHWKWRRNRRIMLHPYRAVALHGRLRFVRSLTCLNGGNSAICGGGPDLCLLKKKGDDSRVHADGPLENPRTDSEEREPTSWRFTGHRVDWLLNSTSHATCTTRFTTPITFSLLLLFCTPQAKRNLY